MTFFKKFFCCFLIATVMFTSGINVFGATSIPQIPEINAEHKILYCNSGFINSVTVPKGKNMYTHGYRMTTRFSNPFTDLSSAGYIEMDIYSDCYIRKNKIYFWLTNNYDLATVRGRIPLPELQAGWNHIVIKTAFIKGDNGFNYFEYDEWNSIFFEGVPSTENDVTLAFGNVALTTDLPNELPEYECSYKPMLKSSADLNGQKSSASENFFSDDIYISEFSEFVNNPVNITDYEFVEFDYFSNKADTLNLAFVTYTKGQTLSFASSRSKTKSVKVNLGWNHIVLPINVSFLNKEISTYDYNKVSGMVVVNPSATYIRLTNLFFTSVDDTKMVDVSKDPILTFRDDFVWGAMLHAPAWGNSFKESNLELQLKQMADMGCKLIRVDVTVNNLPHLDKTVKLCNAYGIKVMLIGYFPNRTADPNISVDYKATEDRFRMLATRYDGKHGCGKADYIQIDNELDNLAINYAPKSSEYKEIEDYSLEALEKISLQVESAINGVKSAETDIKTIINIAGSHYGILKYFEKKGIDWDIQGHDWYDNMFGYGGNPNETYASGDELYNLFKKPIIICETNMFMNTYNGNAEYPNYYDASWWDPLVQVLSNYYSRDYVIGCAVYEFYDEPRHQTTDEWSGEAHFGMIETDINGNFKRFKPIYYRCQKMFGGKETAMLDWKSVKTEYSLWADYDMLDVISIKNIMLGKNGEYNAKADINYDGYVNSSDYINIKKKLFAEF